jgi:O-antigen/teichoic acid export membrane protein
VSITLVLVGFLTTPLLTHDLGILRYGVWALIGSLIPYIELLELGFANATVAFVTKHLELNEEDAVHRILNTSFLILSLLGLLAFGIVVVVAIFLPDLISSIPKDLMDQARVLLLLLAFDMAVSIPMDTFGGALCALQRFDLLNFSQITVTLAQATAWVIVLSLHGGLVLLGVVTVAISLVGQVVRMLMVRRLLPRFRLSPRAFDRALLRSFTVLSGWYSLLQGSDAVLGGADVVIVAAAAGVRAAAVYSVAQRLGQLPVKIVMPRVFLLFTKATQLTARGDGAGLREAIEQITRLVLALAVPAALTLGLLAGPTIRAWVGPEYHQAALIIGVMCIAGCIQSWALTLRTALSGSGSPRISALVYATETVVHVALGIILARRYGAIGMAIAVLIGVVVLEGAILLPVAYRKLDTSLRNGLFAAIRALALPGLGAGAAAWLLGRGQGPLMTFTYTHGKITGLLVVAAAGIATLGVFYALFFFVGLQAGERHRFVAWSHTQVGRLDARRR